MTLWHNTRRSSGNRQQKRSAAQEEAILKAKQVSREYEDFYKRVHQAKAERRNNKADDRFILNRIPRETEPH